MGEDWKLNKKNVNEVSFANHLFEFVRFYETHQKLCDEIAGLKERRFYSGNSEKTLIITKENFWYGIKRLQSFVIDYLHYVKDRSDISQLEYDLDKLEELFINDKRYSELSKKTDRKAKEDIELTEKYIRYLMICFKIANNLCNLLQSSLMISTKEVKKSVVYYNDRQFFENLSKYRKEVSDDLSNFKLSTITDHLKKILSYYYTYKILMKKEEVIGLDQIIPLIVDYILSDRINNYIIDISEDKYLSKEKINNIEEETKELKKILSKIYFLINRSLSDKNVLPKIQRKVFTDVTLI